jgi:membrane-bound serine protease (ClpP class)
MPSPAGVYGTSAAPPAGVVGVVRRAIEPVGSVYAAGEEWSARSNDGTSLERGTPVRIVGTDGLTLIVESDPSLSSQS